MTHAIASIAAFGLGCLVTWQFARLRIRAKVNQAARREKVWRRIAESATNDPILWSLKTAHLYRDVIAEPMR